MIASDVGCREKEATKRRVTMATIKQPEWCNYPDATVPFWGCWSLLEGMVETEEFCKKCECYKNRIDMTKEEKDLLLCDLCARFPHGVQTLKDLDKEFDGGVIGELAAIVPYTGKKYNIQGPLFYQKGSLTPVTIEEIRPYLRPMSSMTEEEIEELNNLVDKELKDSEPYFVYEQLMVDFYLSHHLDNRLMIEKGLALLAPDGMYNLEKK